MHYSSQKIEFHILQSFPVSCLNRDDVGTPKSCEIGGVPRARVSSQCGKRAVRLALHDLGVRTGIRTKRLDNLLERACLSLCSSQEEEKAARDAAVTIAGLLSDDTLLFVSEHEVGKLAAAAKAVGFKVDGKAFEKDLKKLAKNVFDKSLDALDIALFGRMVAKAPVMNIEAAASFSHAISTHKTVSDLDYFTAVDDFNEGETGSAHIGASEYNAATYYRYICLDLGQLASSLGNGDGTVDAGLMKKAVEAFTKALFIAVPSARQHVEAAYRPWDYARVYVRKGQPLQASFENPVKAGRGGGFLEPSKAALKSYLDSAEKSFGSMFEKQGCFEWDPAAGYSIDSLISDVCGMIE